MTTNEWKTSCPLWFKVSTVSCSTIVSRCGCLHQTFISVLPVVLFHHVANSTTNVAGVASTAWSSFARTFVCSTAYWNCVPTVTLSFGDMKALFWNCAQVNVSFADGPSNVRDPAVTLSTVTINFFLVRAIQQWVLFLAQHWITVGDCLPIIEDICPIFERLELIVHLHRRYGQFLFSCVSYRCCQWTSAPQTSITSTRKCWVRIGNHSSWYFPQAYTYGFVDTATSLLRCSNAPSYSLRGVSRVSKYLQTATFLGLACSSRYLR